MIFFFSDPCSISGSFRVFFWDIITPDYLVSWPSEFSKGERCILHEFILNIVCFKTHMVQFPQVDIRSKCLHIGGRGKRWHIGPSSPNMGPPAWHQGEKKKGYRFRISGNWPLLNNCAQIWLVYATIEQLLKTNNTLHEISLKSVQFKTHSLQFLRLAYGPNGLSLHWRVGVQGPPKTETV